MDNELPLFGKPAVLGSSAVWDACVAEAGSETPSWTREGGDEWWKLGRVERHAAPPVSEPTRAQLPRPAPYEKDATAAPPTPAYGVAKGEPSPLGEVERGEAPPCILGDSGTFRANRKPHCKPGGAKLPNFASAADTTTVSFVNGSMARDVDVFLMLYDRGSMVNMTLPPGHARRRMSSGKGVPTKGPLAEALRRSDPGLTVVLAARGEAEQDAARVHAEELAAASTPRYPWLISSAGKTTPDAGAGASASAVPSAAATADDKSAVPPGTNIVVPAEYGIDYEFVEEFTFGQLGLELEVDADTELVTVRSCLPGGQAANSANKISAGDVITEVNGQPVRSLAAFLSEMEARAGDDDDDVGGADGAAVTSSVSVAADKGSECGDGDEGFTDEDTNNAQSRCSSCSVRFVRISRTGSFPNPGDANDEPAPKQQHQDGVDGDSFDGDNVANWGFDAENMRGGGLGSPDRASSSRMGSRPRGVSRQGMGSRLQGSRGGGGPLTSAGGGGGGGGVFVTGIDVDSGLAARRVGSGRIASAPPADAARFGTVEGMGTSTDDTTPIILQFCNNDSVRTVEVLWVDYTGRGVLRRRLGPGQSYMERSFATHPWEIREVLDSNAEQQVLAEGERADVERWSHGHSLLGFGWKSMNQVTGSAVADALEGDALGGDEGAAAGPGGSGGTSPSRTASREPGSGGANNPARQMSADALHRATSSQGGPRSGGGSRQQLHSRGSRGGLVSGSGIRFTQFNGEGEGGDGDLPAGASLAFRLADDAASAPRRYSLVWDPESCSVSFSSQARVTSGKLHASVSKCKPRDSAGRVRKARALLIQQLRETRQGLSGVDNLPTLTVSIVACHRDKLASGKDSQHLSGSRGSWGGGVSRG